MRGWRGSDGTIMNNERRFEDLGLSPMFMTCFDCGLWHVTLVVWFCFGQGRLCVGASKWRTWSKALSGGCTVIDDAKSAGQHSKGRFFRRWARPWQALGLLGASAMITGGLKASDLSRFELRREISSLLCELPKSIEWS